LWGRTREDQALRIDYEADSQGVVGFNVMGLRALHDVGARGIDRRSALSPVVEHLAAANFDAEFAQRTEPEALGA